MALRSVTLATGQAAQPRTREEWTRRVEEAIADGIAMLETGRFDELRPLFADIATWEERQHAHQAHLRLVELIFTITEQLPDDAFTQLYEIGAEVLLDVLDTDPAEPMLLNAAGLFLYELLDNGGSEALFKAAVKLDSTLPYARKNLKAVRARKKQPSRVRKRGGAGRTLQALSVRARRVAVKAKPAAGMSVRLCMIVKDEEEMLPGCLEAVAEEVDEIVIVDTGSTDRTAQIAESFGAKVVEFPWNGSFSDARNVSLGAASGD